ncbi:MAG: 50S ribosomal protein L24 [Clostridia bacterium]|jgi:large subunit ribosomal protein L24|nr:50S ribosomal protein L24 [Clostridia bacterium]MBQ3928218.1 50S ribosomal protein L24 [Clostridia bacterium]MBQ7727919.1 50S ribosomal protein L24 [Clostridia bacterium]
MAKLHIKKGDNVIVLSGDEKGVQGEVIATSPSEGKVIVKGVHMIKKHVKPRRQGEAGGIIEAEGAIYASKVALYCSKCGKGVRTKNVVKSNGKKVRVCVHCGTEL